MFDRQHVGVPRRLQQELHHHVEALEGVMDQDIFLADRGETVAAMIADTFRKPRLEGLELEFGPICRDQLGQFVQSQKALDQNDVLRLCVQRLRNELA